MKKLLNLTLIIMYVVMSSVVTIGSTTIRNIQSCEAIKSVSELSNSATVVIPKQINYKDKYILDVIKVGDPVTIKLAYDGVLNNEFSGYVRKISTEAPISIECDDEFYPLRQTNFIKSYSAVTLKQLLTDLKLPFKIDCPDVKLGKFNIDNASAFNVLEELQKQYGFYSKIEAKTLFVGFAYDWKNNITRNHTYTLGVDTKKNNLEYKTVKDFKIKVRACSNQPKGKKITVEVGCKDKDASVRTLNIPGKTEAELRAIANSNLAKISFDGYQGSIDGFGMPMTQAGDSLTVVNPEFKNRTGTYLIDKVEVKYNDQGGYTRTNHISTKI